MFNSARSICVTERGLPSIEVEAAPDDVVSSSNEMQQLWPLGEIDTKRARFPCCIVWIPLPVVSWLAPYIGHVGIAREDGTVMDFAGSNFVSVDELAYGAVARCLQLDRKKVRMSSRIYVFKYRDQRSSRPRELTSILSLLCEKFPHFAFRKGREC